MWSKRDFISVLTVHFLLGFAHAFQSRQTACVYQRSAPQGKDRIAFAPSPRKHSEYYLSSQKQTSLFSLKSLLDDVSNDSMSGTRTVFVGGKGTKAHSGRRVIIRNIVMHHSILIILLSCKVVSERHLFLLHSR